MKTITATIPEKTIKFANGSERVIEAHEKVFTQSDVGRWTDVEYNQPAFEEDVVKACQGATNWAEIKAEHFPMVGFHS